MVSPDQQQGFAALLSTLRGSEEGVDQSTGLLTDVTPGLLTDVTPEAPQAEIRVDAATQTDPYVSPSHGDSVAHEETKASKAFRHKTALESTLDASSPGKGGFVNACMNTVESIAIQPFRVVPPSQNAESKKAQYPSKKGTPPPEGYVAV
jgi:hypothetical protein